jgi:hypothetical protein
MIINVTNEPSPKPKAVATRSRVATQLTPGIHWRVGLTVAF